MTFIEYINNLTRQCGWSTPETVNDSLVKLVMGVNEHFLKDTVYIGHEENQNGSQFFKFQSEGVPIGIMIDNMDIEAQRDFLMWMLNRNSQMLFGQWVFMGNETKGFFSVVLRLDAGKVDAETFKVGVGGVLGEIYNLFEYMGI